MFAKGKYLRIKHKKANIVASMIQGENAKEALQYLRYVPKKAAAMIYKVLKSAISNAENNFKKTAEKLVVEHVIVNKGPELKRIRPVSRGRAHRITKGVSHITVILKDVEDEIKEGKDKKVTAKKDIKKAEAKANDKKVEKKPAAKKTTTKKTTKK